MRHAAKGTIKLTSCFLYTYSSIYGSSPVTYVMLAACYFGLAMVDISRCRKSRLRVDSPG